VTCEVCPQHFLLFGEEIYQKLGTRAVCNPPLRDKSHAAGLWEGIRSGTIQCLATDHAPHLTEEKDRPFGKAPAGMPGVETALPLMLTRAAQENIPLPVIARWMSAGPAAVYKIKGKGKIEEGYDGDLVLVDLKKVKTVNNGKLVTRANWSPYDGWELKGWPVVTVVNGNIVFREGDFFDEVKGREVEILQE